MSNKSHENAALLQKHQLDSVSGKLSELEFHLGAITQHNLDQSRALDDLNKGMSELLNDLGIDIDSVDEDAIECHDCIKLTDEETRSTRINIGKLDLLDFDESMDWQDCVSSYDSYAQRNHVDLAGDPFDRLLTPEQRVAIEKRLKEEFTLKGANCDIYDYMLAGTCGIIGGLVDILFVGLPGGGELTKFTDDVVGKSVEKFASYNGWRGQRVGSDPTKSAIGYLENKFRVNYDHAHGGAVDGRFKMSTNNHHLKNLAHSPDLLGLFFSILDQFTSTAHFVANSKILSIETETFDLKGGNFVSKIFAGFVNWLGHLISDIAGSSGASSRGSGIPIPFYSLFQFVNVGEFGQHKQSFAKIATQVFEKGYDFRHGMAMAIPVLITELLTRLMWSMKQRFYHEQPWRECIPSTSNPELRRMLLVGHGSLCMMDAGDAALKSGCDMTQFLLRTNLVAWARFGHLALKELKAWYPADTLDTEAVDEYLEAEYEKMLEGGRSLG
jgi:hypothetical protein